MPAIQQLSLFNHAVPQSLAARLRPETPDDYVRQEHILGRGKVLRRLIEQEQIFSMLFWDPPGVGKTTLPGNPASRCRAQYSFHWPPEADRRKISLTGDRFFRFR